MTAISSATSPTNPDLLRQKITALAMAEEIKKTVESSSSALEEENLFLTPSIESLKETIEKTRAFIHKYLPQSINKGTLIREFYSSSSERANLLDTLKEVGEKITSINLDGDPEDRSSSPSVSADNMRKFLKECPNLIHVSARHLRLKDRDLKNAFDNTRWSDPIILDKLTSLDLSHNGLTFKDWSARDLFFYYAIPERKIFPTLQTLDLSANLLSRKEINKALEEICSEEAPPKTEKKRRKE